MIIMNDKYILMCKEAKEIQEIRKRWPVCFWEDGDLIYLTPNYDPYLKEGIYSVVDGYIVMISSPGIYEGDYVGGLDYEDIYEVIWLPRQEDLQKICLLQKGYGSRFSEFMLLRKFHDWAIDYEYSPFRSLNELWLCFVMETVYGKVWNGKTWIGSNDNYGFK